jgi:competence protein ComEC
MLLITHFHKDHAGGLDYLGKGKFNVGKIIAYAKPENLNMDITPVVKGDYIKADGIEIKILSPDSDDITVSSEDKNETCIIMELRYKNFSMLFTADAEKEALESITGNFDILKVPHHGSIYSLNEKLLDNSEIGNAVISVGKNSFGHPSPQVINELKKRNIGVYRTDKQGDIII